MVIVVRFEIGARFVFSHDRVGSEHATAATTTTTAATTTTTNWQVGRLAGRVVCIRGGGEWCHTR
jgi:hypothetical protein